jgi:hypothetical protein
MAYARDILPCHNLWEARCGPSRRDRPEILRVAALVQLGHNIGEHRMEPSRFHGIDLGADLDVAGDLAHIKQRLADDRPWPLRLDEEITDPLGSSGSSAIIDAADVIVLSDYAKGVLCDGVLEVILARAKETGQAAGLGAGCEEAAGRASWRGHVSFAGLRLTLKQLPSADTRHQFSFHVRSDFHLSIVLHQRYDPNPPL